MNTESLTIKLHEDAGPFYLKDTLQVVSRSPTLKHIQNVQYDIESAEVTLTFPAAHRQSSGTQVTLQIPGQEQVRKVIVPITVLDKTRVKVKYIDAVHSGPFRSYYFSSSTKVVCYDSVKYKKKNGETMQLAVSEFTVDANEKLNVKQGLSQKDVDTYAIVGETTSPSHQGCLRVSSSQLSRSELVHTNVLVDKITTCTRASGCTYYCHGGSETWDEVVRDPSKYSTYTVQFGDTVKFPVNNAADHVPLETAFSGPDLTVSFAAHSCARSGVKIAIEKPNVGESIFPSVTPICDRSAGARFECVWTHEHLITVKRKI